MAIKLLVVDGRQKDMEKTDALREINAQAHEQVNRHFIRHETHHKLQWWQNDVLLASDQDNTS